MLRLFSIIFWIEKIFYSILLLLFSCIYCMKRQMAWIENHVRLWALYYKWKLSWIFATVIDTRVSTLLNFVQTLNFEEKLWESGVWKSLHTFQKSINSEFQWLLHSDSESPIKKKFINFHVQLLLWLQYQIKIFISVLRGDKMRVKLKTLTTWKCNEMF